MALEIRQDPFPSAHRSGQTPVTLDLFADNSRTSISRQNIKGVFLYKEKQLLLSEMNRKEKQRANGSGGNTKLDLKLNLSPPKDTTNCRNNVGNNSPLSLSSPSSYLSSSTNSSGTSPPSSCVSSEMNPDHSGLRYSTSPEATSMVLVGCPRCLMYVMLSEDDPRCPKCKNTCLLDFLNTAAGSCAPTDKSKKF